MRRFVLSLVLAVVAPLAFAAEPAVLTPPTDAQIDQLLDLTHAKALAGSMLAQVEASQRTMMDQALRGQTVSADQRQTLDRLQAALDAQLRTMLSWDRLRPIYQRVYKATFEAQDVDAMIAFYGTPSGQRLIERMPTLMQKTMAEMNGMMVPLMRDFQDNLAKELAAPKARAAKN